MKATNGLYLLIDLGGTHVRFALCRPGGEPYARERVRCEQYSSFEESIKWYVNQEKEAADLVGALIDIAAPIKDTDRITLTNRDWSFSARELRAILGVKLLAIVNDFVAIAMAAPRFPKESLYKIGEGEPSTNHPIVVIGPGTGLGMAGIIPFEGKWIPISSEGGHVTFPQCNKEEESVVRALRECWCHVSAERIISGPGLYLIYEALANLQEKPAPLEKPADVMQAAAEKSCTVAQEAVNIFFLALGTLAADICLTFCARGGVYIAGGIIPQVLDLFEASGFRERFESKGRFADYLSSVPTYVVTQRVPAFRGLISMVEEDFYPSGGLYVFEKGEKP